MEDVTRMSDAEVKETLSSSAMRVVSDCWHRDALQKLKLSILPCLMRMGKNGHVVVLRMEDLEEC